MHLPSVIGPSPICFGKYAHKGLTLESLLFLHPRYVLWMLQEFPDTDPWKERLVSLVSEFDRRNIVVTCQRQVVSHHACDQPASALSVAGYGRFTNVRSALFICNRLECRSSFCDNAGGGISFFPRNYIGLKTFAEGKPHEASIVQFARKLAIAYGISSPTGHLTQVAIHHFFHEQSPDRGKQITSNLQGTDSCYLGSPTVEA